MIGQHSLKSSHVVVDWSLGNRSLGDRFVAHMYGIPEIQR